MPERNVAAPSATITRRRPRLNVDALIAIRMRQGLSRLDLARRAGVHRSALWRIEEGGVQARTATIRALADALGVPVIALLDIESTETTRPR